MTRSGSVNRETFLFESAVFISVSKILNKMSLYGHNTDPKSFKNVFIVNFFVEEQGF